MCVLYVVKIKQKDLWKTVCDMELQAYCIQYLQCLTFFFHMNKRTNFLLQSVPGATYWCHSVKLFVSDNVPEELKDPFYIDQYEQEHIKPPVIKLLLSSELYCRVCSLILKGDQVAALQGHQSVIQALSRKGIYVMESDDTPVSESDLGCAPIKMVSLIKST